MAVAATTRGRSPKGFWPFSLDVLGVVHVMPKRSSKPHHGEDENQTAYRVAQEATGAEPEAHEAPPRVGAEPGGSRLGPPRGPKGW